MRLLLPGTVGLIDDALLQSFQWCLLSLIGSISSLWKIQFMNRNSSSAVRSFFSTLSTHTERVFVFVCILSCLSHYQLSNLCGQQNSFNSHIETAYNFPIWQTITPIIAEHSVPFFGLLLRPILASRLVPIRGLSMENPAHETPLDFVIIVLWTLVSPPRLVSSHEWLYQCFLKSELYWLIIQLRSIILHSIIGWLCLTAFFYMQLTIRVDFG